MTTDTVPIAVVCRDAVSDFQQLYTFFREHRNTILHDEIRSLVEKQGHILTGIQALRSAKATSILFTHPSSN